MLFNSVHFLLFFSIVVLFYFVLPQRVRWVWLLVASYYFYMSWNVKYALLMTASIVITYLSGLLIQWAGGIKNQRRNMRVKRLWVFLSFALNLGILFLFKYFTFAFTSLRTVLAAFGVTLTDPGISLLLPVGISFYTFKALSYTMDVYNGDIGPEKNFFRYALFVSFFPQLVAGPIDRAKNLLPQIRERHTFDGQRVCDGLLLMLWGYFQKVVIADRLAIFVNEAYANHGLYGGWTLVIATVLFAVQLYADFAGYSNIAIGAGQVMGFKLAQNFRQPYFATSIQDFWRRWHISLSSWFGDYLYTPLVWSRWTEKLPIVGKYMKKPPVYSSLMIVFLASGLWHGASWAFIVWGGLNGLYQVIGHVLKPAKDRLFGLLRVNTKAGSFKLGKILVTFLLVCFSYIFFKAGSLQNAFDFIGSMFSGPQPWALVDGTLYTLGLTQKQFHMVLLAIFALFCVDLYKYKNPKASLRGVIARQNIAFRWALYVVLLFAVLVFGAYGRTFDASAFIYFQF